MYLDVMRAAVRAVEAGRAGVLCTVLDHLGSAPGRRHNKLLLLDDGTRVGTVGGGTLEAAVLAAAAEVLRSGRGRALSLSVTEAGEGATGGVCGGRVEIALEPLPVVPRVLVCGAGHCAEELGRSMDQLGYPYEVHDDRPELVDGVRFPGAAARHVGPVEALVEALGDLERFSHVLLVSRGHGTDRAYGRVLLRAGYPRWIGMLGSPRKSRIVRTAWTDEDGLDALAVARVECPVGLPIGASSPAEIAYSVLARIIALRSEAGAR